MTTDLNRDSIARAYARWAPVYDRVFGKVFERGRHAAIAAVEAAVPTGGRLLEVGVGTGISLPDYRRDIRIVGLDISAPMLQRAQQRVQQFKLANVEALSVMDAAKLALPDASFDAVVAQYVITAVPDPDGTLDEFARVVKPGGEIILVNHIGADRGPRAVFEAGFAPLARRLGWRPEFKFSRLSNWASQHGGVELVARTPMPPMGHFSLIQFRRIP
ncbi:MAG: class I SAM-dependent methyltransferase [Pseudolabrys sp.]|nr:class I SAM-dependent methyltransferase [Pseudolabrys sp.]